MRKKRFLPLLILVFALLAAAGGRPSAAGTAGTVVGYYAAWAGGLGYAPEDIPAELFTQIHYAFAKIEDGKAALEDPGRDREALRRLTALRKANADLKIVLAIGGWDESAWFSDAAASEASREVFAESCADLVREHGLDGVDLDWEYPVSGGAPGVVHRPQDRENFTLLLKAVRAALDAQGRRDGKAYVLSIAGAADGGYLNHIEPRAVAEVVDHIFLMAYDLHGPWDPYADFNAPLYPVSGGPSRYRASVDGGISAWLGRGVPAEKLVLGMPLYGYIYQSVDRRNNGLYQSFGSARSISWNQIQRDCLSQGAYRQFFHQEAGVPYLYGNRSFLSYDDPSSIAAKGRFARETGLAGAGAWELSQDRAGRLLAALRAGLAE